MFSLFGSITSLCGPTAHWCLDYNSNSSDSKYTCIHYQGTQVGPAHACVCVPPCVYCGWRRGTRKVIMNSTWGWVGSGCSMSVTFLQDNIQLVWVGVCDHPETGVCVGLCVYPKAGALPYSCFSRTQMHSALHETIYVLEIMGGDMGGGSVTSDPCLVCLHLRGVWKKSFDACK